MLGKDHMRSNRVVCETVPVLVWLSKPFLVQKKRERKKKKKRKVVERFFLVRLSPSGDR